MPQDEGIKKAGLCLSRSLPLVIVCWGSWLRLAQYLFDRSLWLDESMLSVNIVGKSFYELLGPLDYHQGAPLGFLMIEKASVQILGNSEYALRLFPLISGIISLFLYYGLAKQTLTVKMVPIALGLFAISGPLIYYSSETKQYSSDVAIAICLFSAGIYCSSHTLTPWRALALGLLGAASIWFSHPSMFVLAGIGIALSVFCLAKREWSKIRLISIAYSLWALSFVACYVVSLRSLSENKNLLNYWASNFVPWPVVSLSTIDWFIGTFFGTFEYPVGGELSGLAALLFLIGGIALFFNKRDQFLILILPVFITLVASGLHKYPFSGRLILFLVPVLIIFIARGAELIQLKIKADTPLVAWCLIGFLFFHPLIYSTYHLIKPVVRTEIKPVMNYIKEHRRTEDALYVYHWSIPAFRYYAPRLGLDTMSRVMGAYGDSNWHNYENDIDRLRSYRRVWLLFSNSRTQSGEDEEKIFLYFVDKVGAKLDYFKAPDAAAYLYDFNEPG